MDFRASKNFGAQHGGNIYQDQTQADGQDEKSMLSSTGDNNSADISRTQFAPSAIRAAPTTNPKHNALDTRFLLAEVQGLDHRGCPSLDVESLWHCRANLDPAANTAFLRLRSTTQGNLGADDKADGDTKQYIYIYIPPERIASIALDPDPGNICLRLALKDRADLIGPVANPTPRAPADEQWLAVAQWLAARPGLMITVSGPSRVSRASWVLFCAAISAGSVTSHSDSVNLGSLYKRRGGFVINLSDVALDTPPAYHSLHNISREGRQGQPPSQKRQRQESGSLSPRPENVLPLDPKDLLTCLQSMVDKTVARQREEMIAPLLTRIDELKGQVIDSVMDRVEGLLDRRLSELRDELERDIDDRMDLVKDEMKDYVAEQVKEQVEEQVSSVEEDIVKTVLDTIDMP